MRTYHARMPSLRSEGAGRLPHPRRDRSAGVPTQPCALAETTLRGCRDRFARTQTTVCEDADQALHPRRDLSARVLIAICEGAEPGLRGCRDRSARTQTTVCEDADQTPHPRRDLSARVLIAICKGAEHVMRGCGTGWFKAKREVFDQFPKIAQPFKAGFGVHPIESPVRDDRKPGGRAQGPFVPAGTEDIAEP